MFIFTYLLLLFATIMISPEDKMIIGLVCVISGILVIIGIISFFVTRIKKRNMDRNDQLLEDNML